MFTKSTEKNLYSTSKVSIIFLISTFIMMSTIVIAGKQSQATSTDWKLSYFHHDHLGNITAVTDEHGNLLEIKDYLPFGGTNVDEKYENFASDYSYNDKEKDDESNLYYYGARYYLASIFNEFQTRGDNENNPRYVYTEKEGWIDFKHFFGSAFYSLDSGSFMALLFGYIVELDQTRTGDDSAFSYEDLPSNYEGVTFGQVLQYLEDNDLDNIKVSDALKYFFENLDPEDAPNYDELDESAAEGNGKDGSNVGSNDESTNKNDKENGHD